MAKKIITKQFCYIIIFLYVLFTLYILQCKRKVMPLLNKVNIRMIIFIMYLIQCLLNLYIIQIGIFYFVCKWYIKFMVRHAVIFIFFFFVVVLLFKIIVILNKTYKLEEKTIISEFGKAGLHKIMCVFYFYIFFCLNSGFGDSLNIYIFFTKITITRWII
jgi:hypothetical protein